MEVTLTKRMLDHGVRWRQVRRTCVWRSRDAEIGTESERALEELRPAAVAEMMVATAADIFVSPG